MPFESDRWARLAESFPWRSLSRWWAAGLVFTAWGLLSMYWLKDRWQVSLMMASLIVAETGTILRFLVNDRWVFGHNRPTFKRLWQYHVANGGGFVVWWTVCNVLPPLGVHYLLAFVAATACSVGFSILSNFLWVWRRRQTTSASDR